MAPHDLYVEVIDRAHKSTYHYHRVWNSAKFLDTLSAAHKKEGGTVRVITEAEYKAHRK